MVGVARCIYGKSGEFPLAFLLEPALVHLWQTIDSKRIKYPAL